MLSLGNLDDLFDEPSPDLVLELLNPVVVVVSEYSY